MPLGKTIFKIKTWNEKKSWIISSFQTETIQNQQERCYVINNSNIHNNWKDNWKRKRNQYDVFNAIRNVSERTVYTIFRTLYEILCYTDEVSFQNQGCFPREELKSLVKLTKSNHGSASFTKFWFKFKSNFEMVKYYTNLLKICKQMSH